MADRHHRSRLRHRRRKAPEIFKDAFGRPQKREDDATRPSTPRAKRRRLIRISGHIRHRHHSRVHRHRHRKPKLP